MIFIYRLSNSYTTPYPQILMNGKSIVQALKVGARLYRIGRNTVALMYGERFREFFPTQPHISDFRQLQDGGVIKLFEPVTDHIFAGEVEHWVLTEYVRPW